MSEHEAEDWLRKKGWHVTDQRVEALEHGVDLERDCGGCKAWSDGGPCRVCVAHALETKKSSTVH